MAISIALLVLVALGMLAACSSAGSHAGTGSGGTVGAATGDVGTVAGAAGDAGTVGAATAHSGTAASFRPSFADSGLVTNEYAYRHPEDPARRVSPYWIVTSGSLFAKQGAGWTGIPDRETPNAQSSTGTDSAVFRLVSHRRNFGNVRVTFELLVQRHVVGSGSDRHAYDGVHVWLRYASPTQLYALSVMRWDGQVVIKGKVPGGPSNGGSYLTLASARSVIPVGHWVPIDVQAINRSGGVELTIIIAGKHVLQLIDSRRYALTQPGAVGIRGDNTEFQFRNFEARPLQ